MSDDETTAEAFIMQLLLPSDGPSEIEWREIEDDPEVTVGEFNDALGTPILLALGVVKSAPEVEGATLAVIVIDRQDGDEGKMALTLEQARDIQRQFNEAVDMLEQASGSQSVD